MIDCVWGCGRPANSKREDVIPSWMRRKLGGLVGQKQWGRFNLPADVTPGETYDGEFQNALLMRARYVICTTCNNEWMSVMQSRAQSVLEPVIDGSEIDISPTEQASLANWMTMTAIMAEYAHGQVVESYRREYFFTHKEPPPNTRAFLLRVESPLVTAFSGIRRQRKGEPELVHNYVSFLSIRTLGTLVVQGALAGWQNRILSRYARFLVPVWPVALKPRHWPPPSPIDPNTAIQMQYELLGEQAPAPAAQAATEVEAVAVDLAAEGSTPAAAIEAEGGR